VTLNLPRGICIVLLCLLVLGPGRTISSAQNEGPKRSVKTVSDKPGMTSGPGTYYALVIGLSNYHQPFARLQTPNADATEVASVLQNVYGFKTELLLDATRRQIMDAFGRYQHTGTDADSLLIYIAGHGMNQKNQGITYLVPIDADQTSFANYITNQEITGTMSAVPVRHVLLIADTCFSGTIRVSGSRGDRFAEDSSDATSPIPYLERMARNRSRDVMAAGGDEPVADGDGNGNLSKHSIFATALLQNLTRMPDLEFTGSDLFQSVQHKVVGQSPQYDALDECEKCTQRGDFVFKRVGGGQQFTLPEKEFVVPAVHHNPDLKLVDQALDAYVDGYTSMDLHLLKKAWPTLSKNQEREIKDGFKEPGLKAVQVQLRNRNTNIAGNVATALCDQWMIYTYDGRRQPPQTNPVEISLLKDDQGGWTVTAVKGK
jgi:hypothetical protein